MNILPKILKTVVDNEYKYLLLYVYFEHVILEISLNRCKYHIYFLNI